MIVRVKAYTVTSIDPWSMGGERLMTDSEIVLRAEVRPGQASASIRASFRMDLYCIIREKRLPDGLDDKLICRAIEAYPFDANLSGMSFAFLHLEQLQELPNCDTGVIE